jgi:hypothetical protein
MTKQLLCSDGSGYRMKRSPVDGKVDARFDLEQRLLFAQAPHIARHEVTICVVLEACF